MEQNPKKSLQVNVNLLKDMGRKDYHDLNSPAEVFSSNHTTYSPQTERHVQPKKNIIKVDVSEFKTQVSSFRAYDRDLLDMPPFDFETNQPTNWSSFTKDLSILSPGFLPKNRILLKRYLQNSNIDASYYPENAYIHRQKEDSIIEDSNQPKKKKLTEEELKEKRRKEKPYSYENYVEQRNNNMNMHAQTREKLREIQKRMIDMEKKARIRYYQYIHKQRVLAAILENDDFIFHGHFIPETSLPCDSVVDDSFDVLNHDDTNLDDQEKTKIPSNHHNSGATTSVLDRSQFDDKSYERGFSRKSEQKSAKTPLLKQRADRWESNSNSNNNVMSNQNSNQNLSLNALSVSKIARRKSDSSQWSGGISRMEVKTLNLFVDCPRIRKNKKRRSDLTSSDSQVRERGVTDYTALSRFIDKSKNPKMERSGSFLHKRKPSENLRLPSAQASHTRQKSAGKDLALFTKLKLGNTNSGRVVNDSSLNSSLSRRSSGNRRFFHDNNSEKGADFDKDHPPLLEHSASSPQDLRYLIESTFRDDFLLPNNSSQVTIKSFNTTEVPRLLINNQSLMVSSKSSSPTKSKELESPSNEETVNLASLSPIKIVGAKLAQRKFLLNPLTIDSEIQEVDSYTPSPSNHTKRSQNSMRIERSNMYSSTGTLLDEEAKQSSSNKEVVQHIFQHPNQPKSKTILGTASSEYQFGRITKPLNKKKAWPTMTKLTSQLVETMVSSSASSGKQKGKAGGGSYFFKNLEMKESLTSRKQSPHQAKVTKNKKIMNVYAPRRSGSHADLLATSGLVKFTTGMNFRTRTHSDTFSPNMRSKAYGQFESPSFLPTKLMTPHNTRVKTASQVTSEVSLKGQRNHTNGLVDRLKTSYEWGSATFSPRVSQGFAEQAISDKKMSLTQYQSKIGLQKFPTQSP